MHLALHAVSGHQRIPVPSCLAYCADDPYTVYLHSHTDTEIPVTWALSRELLTAGTRRWAGAGAVSVFPGRSDDAGGLYLLLAGENRAGEGDDALLRAQASDVKAFLRWSEHIVPPGRESEYLDLDATIYQLLEDGPEM